MPHTKAVYLPAPTQHQLTLLCFMIKTWANKISGITDLIFAVIITVPRTSPSYDGLFICGYKNRNTGRDLLEFGITVTDNFVSLLWVQLCF